MIQEFVRQMCQELDILPVPAMNDQKFIPFQLGSQIEVEIRDLDPGFSLFSKIAVSPKKMSEEFLTSLMEANYLGQKTGPARIGMSADEKFLTLSSGFPYEMSYRAFLENCEDFINFLLYWREETNKLEMKEA